MTPRTGEVFVCISGKHPANYNKVLVTRIYADAVGMVRWVESKGGWAKKGCSMSMDDFCSSYRLHSKVLLPKGSLLLEDNDVSEYHQDAAAGGDEASRAQHTPGPWEHSPRNAFVVYAAPLRGWVAQVCERKDGQEHANTRLIASAPELLCALRDLVEVASELPTFLNKADLACIARARAAITKAEGAR